MPPLIAALPGIIAGITLSTAFTVASIAMTIGMTVFGAVGQMKAAKRAKRAAARAREDFLNSLQERTITRIATEAPHRYVYGKAKVGADIVAMLQSGDNEQYKHLVCVHAAGESEAIEEVYINGKALGTLDADGYVTQGDYYSARTEHITETFATSPFTLTHTPSSAIKVLAVGTLWSGQFPLPYGPQSVQVSYTRVGNTFTVTSTAVTSVPGATLRTTGYSISYQYEVNTSQVRVRKHLGTPDDPADASLLAECPDKWKDTAVLRGFTYTVIRLDLRQAEFQGGVPEINVLMKGRKLYDPRTGLTAWSDNPALVTLDYLTSEMCGVDLEDIPSASYITAANACDEQVEGLC
jgi:hypothetical protein